MFKIEFALSDRKIFPSIVFTINESKLRLKSRCFDTIAEIGNHSFLVAVFKIDSRWFDLSHSCLKTQSNIRGRAFYKFKSLSSKLNIFEHEISKLIKQD